jgi:hypothetical protein
LAEFVREDLEIAKREAHTPHHTLREGVLTERHRQDQSGRPIIEFYSKSGPSVWMDQFKDPMIKMVSGGSKGILTPDHPRPPTYSFNRTQMLPELVALQKQSSYQDSAEYKIAEAYRAVGKEPPADLLKQLAK